MLRILESLMLAHKVQSCINSSLQSPFSNKVTHRFAGRDDILPGDAKLRCLIQQFRSNVRNNDSRTYMKHNLQGIESETP